MFNNCSVFSGTFFSQETKIKMQNVSCNRIPESVIRTRNDKCNGSNNTLAEIGFQIEKTKFLTMIDICFDQTNYRTVYIKHTVYPEVNVRQITNGVSFRNAETFLFENLGDRPGSLYKCTEQKATLLKLLGSEDIASKYISCRKGGTRLVKGHLSPNADFIFSYQQNATYYHSNAAPQWQFFNNRNWKALEKRIRSHVQYTDQEHHVFTGTSKTPTFLEDNNNNIVLIHLSADNDKMPAPLYYWKILFHPKTMSGIGFIGYNLHFNQSLQSFKIPHLGSICSEKLWFKESEINLEKGLIYCSEVKDLISIIDFKDFKHIVKNVIEFKSRNIPRETPIDEIHNLTLMDLGI